jgi:hypothetical protein
MDIVKMVAALREERALLEEVIIAMERLARGQGKRRGRPPAWMSAMRNAAPRRGRPPGSKNKSVRVGFDQVTLSHWLPIT